VVTVEGSPYLPTPRSALAEQLARLKMRCAYRVWQRCLRQYAGCTRESEFRVLDVGCGPGHLLICLRSWYPQATLVGVDIAADLLAYAGLSVDATELVRADAHRLGFGHASFEVVFALQVIEHLSDPARFFHESYRVLHAGGLLLLATPNPTGCAARLLGRRWQGLRSDHVTLRTPHEWRKELEHSGFEVLDDGSTLFNGIPIVGRLPLGLPFQLLQAVFGYFPWYLGESYMAVARKR